MVLLQMEIRSMKCDHCTLPFDENGYKLLEFYLKQVDCRIEFLQFSFSLSGANPNIAEKDIYASRPMDIAVLNDDSASVEVV